MKKIYFFLILSVLNNYLFAQKSTFNTNQLTGAASAMIPVYGMSRGNVSLPITLSYYSSGVKAKDVESSAGMGWQVTAGGQIIRQLRGLPDDCKKDGAGNARLGWLYNTNGTKISSFTIANGGSGTACTNEAADLSYINTNFTDLSDTEPDIFSVSAPGLSCQLVFDASHNIHPINYQDLVITVNYNNITTDPKFGLITSFTIVNDQGTKYVFSVAERAIDKPVLTRGGSGTSTPIYFLNKYNQYKDEITYYDCWYLKSITDVNGNGLTLNYTSQNDDPAVDSVRHSWDDINLYQGASTGSTTLAYQYSMGSSVYQQYLTSVAYIDNGYTTSPPVTFSYLLNPQTGQKVISSVFGGGKIFNFNYTTMFSTDSHDSYGRMFLTGFSDDVCSTPNSYKFDYSGIQTGNRIPLGDSSSYHTDYWGYCNHDGVDNTVPGLLVNPLNTVYQRYVIENALPSGSDYSVTLPSGDKVTDPSSIDVGMLNKITYSTGGTTSIVYEPNDYFNVPSGSTLVGGGARVHQVTDYDGINTASNIVTTYTYTNPTNAGNSSGKPVSLPVYGFTTPSSVSGSPIDVWNYATIRSKDDLSPEDHSIMYEYVTAYRPGLGSTVSQYYLPATNWDNTATPACDGCTTADWNRTIDYTARPTCVSYGKVANDISTYPFAPNPNYDFERGLLLKQSSYSDASPGVLVSESTYKYKRSSPPLNVAAFRFETNNGVTAYAKYTVNYTTGELTSEVNKKVYGPALTQVQSSTTRYTYNATYYKLIKQESTNSDNSVVDVYTNYSKDYSVPAMGSDSTVNGLYHLQHLNINTPVETYTQITRGPDTKTISAQVTKFKTVAYPAALYRYLPSQSMSLLMPDGGTYTAMTISGGAVTYDTKYADPKYVRLSNFTAFDKSGLLQTGDDGHKHINTIITDHFTANPVAGFKNAAVNEIAFNDFDSSLPDGVGFTPSPAFGSTPLYSHTGSAYSFTTASNFSKTMVKKAAAGTYILSAWLGSASAVSGNITVTLTPTGGSPASSLKAFATAAGGSTYFEWTVNMSAITSGFTIRLTTSAAVNIDDILFYPQIAEATTYAYDPATFYKTAQTNTNGISAYYKNDQWGRLLYRYDQDKNIVERMTYVAYNAVTTGLPVPAITVNPVYPENQVLASPITFDAVHSCITGVTYTWNFGDGSPPVTGLDLSHQTHTYTSTALLEQHTPVTLTVTHPIYGTKTSTADVYLEYPPLQPTICMSGAVSWDNCTHQASATADCLTPTDNRHTSYTVFTPVPGSGYGTLHYQWQTSFDNGVNWINVGTDSPVYTQACGAKNAQYLTHCTVSSDVPTFEQPDVTTAYANFTVQDCP